MTDVFIREKIWTHNMHREEKALSLTLKSHVMKEAETGMLQLQAWEPKDLQPPPATRKKQRLNSTQTFEQVWPCCLSFSILAISVVLSLSACGTL